MSERAGVYNAMSQRDTVDNGMRAMTLQCKWECWCIQWHKRENWCTQWHKKENWCTQWHKRENWCTQWHKRENW
jgi:hypothetical protein